jgi:hypothetical protein
LSLPRTDVPADATLDAHGIEAEHQHAGQRVGLAVVDRYDRLAAGFRLAAARRGLAQPLPPPDQHDGKQQRHQEPDRRDEVRDGLPLPS